MNTAVHYNRGDEQSSSMTGSLTMSAVFHVVLFIITAVGLPFVAKEPLLISTPISVELVEIAEITQTNKPAPPKSKSEDTPPKPSKPEPVKQEPPPKLEEKPSAPEPVKKEAEPIPDLKPKEPPKKPEKPKAQPKLEPVKEKKDFQSLLKNLTPDLEVKSQDNPLPDQIEDPIDSSGQIARLSDRLTISELDSFKRQIEPCWNVPTGAKYAENLAVEIRVFMNPDRTLRRAVILDQGRYGRDTHFRAAADSAIRALRNPACSPLKLPPEKYDQWKTIVIRFDPREML